MSSDKNKITDNIGERLRCYRKSLKMSGDVFSKLIGISQGSLSDIETGKTSPSTKTFEGLVRNTDIDLKWLLTGKKINQEKSESRKYEILDEAEEWLNEEIRKNPDRKIWFEVELLDAFPKFMEWRRKRAEEKDGEDEYPASKVA